MRTPGTVTVKDIVKAHLESIGADGLCREDCGCPVQSLMPCDGQGIENCTPARYVKCQGCKRPEDERPEGCDEVAGCYQPKGAA